MTARGRFVLVPAVALVLAGPVLLYFLGRLVLSNDAVLLDHVSQRRTPLVELPLWAGADPNGPGIAELARRSGNVAILQLLEAGAITAEALLTLAEVGLNARIIGNKIIEGMLCIFTLGFGC